MRAGHGGDRELLCDADLPRRTRGRRARRRARRRLPLDRRGRPRWAALVAEARLSGLHLLRVARRPALARAGLCRPRAAPRPPRRGVREGARVRSQARQAEARFDLDQRPAAGRGARRAYPSALGRQRHLLRRGAGGRECDQVRGSAPRLHDGGAAEKAEGGAPEPAIRLDRAAARHGAALGKLASPRGAAERSRGRPHQRQLQLPLALRAGTAPGAQALPLASYSPPRTPSVPASAPVATGIPHGADHLPSVVVDSYNVELRDKEGFVGDRASNRAIRAILEDWRERLRQAGEDPLGDTSSGEISKKKLDKLLAEGEPEAAGVIQGAIEDFAPELATVIRRFLRLKGWRDTERIAVGGGLRESRIGELAVGRAAVLLKAAGVDIELAPIGHHPDEAGLIGAEGDREGRGRRPAD